jgi:hypothetical protein
MSKPTTDGFEYLILGVLFLYMCNIFSLMLIWFYPSLARIVVVTNMIVLGICLFKARHVMKGLSYETKNN